VSDYFAQLNYTLANEDTAVELGVLQENVGHVCAIAGSGGRVLPLFAKKPRRMTCVDVSPIQLELTELRIESARHLEHEEFLAFWGYPPGHETSPDERRALFSKLELRPTLAAFWRGWFAARGWECMLYEGRWEHTFCRLSKIIRRVLGRGAEGLFQAESSQEFATYLAERFPYRRWLLCLLFLGNATVFNALLYKRSFPKKNIPESFFGFYRRCFDGLFTLGPARESFFLQLVMLGELRYPEGNPLECQPDLFAKVKEGIQGAQIEFRGVDLTRSEVRLAEPIDFLSFSDVPSYFSGELEREYLQRLRDKLAQDGVVVLRYYMHVPEGTRKQGFEDISEDYRELIAREKVGVYKFDLLRRT
jgi:S-adenosylmethionine-diacylglycerol 3-amino-3-carboxypropyl transferase